MNRLSFLKTVLLAPFAGKAIAEAAANSHPTPKLTQEFLDRTVRELEDANVFDPENYQGEWRWETAEFWDKYYEAIEKNAQQSVNRKAEWLAKRLVV